MLLYYSTPRLIPLLPYRSTLFLQQNKTQSLMISLKAIQTSFAPNHGSLFHEKYTFKKRRLVLSFCKSNSSDSSDQEIPPPPNGDSSKQELLVRIAMLQTQKVRLTDYLDERSAYLTQFAEEANAEIDQIGENALRELDEAGARIMGNMESRMQAFEESMEMDKVEIEENEQKVADFECQVEKERNDGLFFKSLTRKSPVDRAEAKEEAEKIREVAKKNADSVIRRNTYLALVAVVVAGLVDAAISSTSDWKKVGVLVVVLVGLITQLIYEQSMLTEAENQEEEKSKH